jgi:uncharacterized hydantoinase/oxoprolinase family protein
VYTGVRRTPVCALLGDGLAAEFFATTLDAYLLLGIIAENGSDYGTADGKPATRTAAHARLARMSCEDRESCPESRTRQLASAVHERQLEIIRRAVECVVARMARPPRVAIVSGAGEFLAAEVLRTDAWSDVRQISFAQTFGRAASDAACAFALAKLGEDLSTRAT